MARNKSILEKFADTLRDIAKTASDAASEALNAEEPAGATRGRRTAACVPLAGAGFVSDPLIMPPPAEPRRRRKGRAAPKRAAKTPARKRSATKRRTAPSTKSAK